MNSFLPFLEYAPVIKEYYGIKVDTSLLYLQGSSLTLGDNILYLVQPLNILVPKSLNRKSLDSETILEATIIEVDYSQVANILTTVKGIAYYPQLGDSYEEQAIETEYLINLASNGVVLQELPKIKNKSCTGEPKVLVNLPEGIVNEASLDTFANASVKAITINTQSPIQTRIDSYLNGGYVTQRILLLVGPSAVAKSAQVKAVCNKYNYRMVDLRTAFMSRLDLQGLTDIVYNSDGSVNSEQSPMQEFITCTDEFIKFSRAAVPVIEKYINNETNENKKKELINLKKSYEEYSKVPVLFLDEISRTEASVRQALTNILSSKEFMGHKMTIARIIAADNHPIDSPDELKDIFLTNTTEDSAFNERFEAIPVTPEDVLPSWLDWAILKKPNGNQNIHPAILEFLELNPKLYYDYSEVENRFLDDFDEYKLSVTPYPNYRTWEFTSNYIYEAKDVQFSTLEGFLGAKTATKLTSFLKTKGINVEPNKDGKEDWNLIIKDAIVNRTPTLLASPSGLGKTSNIHRISKELGAITIDINLSELDRTDIMGPPAKVNTVSHIGGQLDIINEDLSKELMGVASGFDLPQNITVRAPRIDVARKFKQSIDEGRKVVLVFDELTRVTNPATMSAVFEAISDNRIFGITFDPTQVSIICACNIGANFQDTQRLDPAFAARLNIHTKDAYTKDDVDSIRNHIKTNYNPYLSVYFDKLTDDEIVDLVSQVEERSIEQSVPSTRAFNDLSLYLDDDKSSSLCVGSIIFKSVSDRRKANLSLTCSDINESSMKDCLTLIDSSINNWAALDTSISVQVGSENISARELKDLYIECIDEINKGNMVHFPTLKKIISALVTLDVDVQNLRRQTVGYITGNAFADKFCEYYNTVSGTKIVVIKVSDLKDYSLYTPYIEQQLLGLVAPEAMRNAVLQSYEDIYKEFNLNLTVDHYREFITKGVGKLPTADSRLNLIKSMVVSPSIDSMLKKAEDGDTSFGEALLSSGGIKADLSTISTSTVSSRTRFI